MGMYLCENCGSDIHEDEYNECHICGAALCPDCVCEDCENAAAREEQTNNSLNKQNND